MDGTRFDQLIKRIATTRVSRLTALRGLAAAAVASLAGISLLGEEGAAKKDNPKKRKVCLCSPASCTTKRVKNRTKVIRRNAPCAYKGKCTSLNPCAAAQPTTTTNPPPPGRVCTEGEIAPNGQVCVNNQFVNCTNVNQCGTIAGAGARACIAGRCRGGNACASDAECVNPLRCADPIDVPATTPDICLIDNECNANFGATDPTLFDCPAGLPLCVAGECTRACDPGDNCGANMVCDGGVCVPV
jgi:hypothetical protein